MIERDDPMLLSDPEDNKKYESSDDKYMTSMNRLKEGSVQTVRSVGINCKAETGVSQACFHGNNSQKNGQIFYIRKFTRKFVKNL